METVDIPSQQKQAIISHWEDADAGGTEKPVSFQIMKLNGKSN